MVRALLIAGLGYGDEGKGSVVDYLTRQEMITTGASPTIVRYNGGAQAAHTVVLKDKRCHTFSQFGSGTLVPGVRTHLSRHMLVNPLFLESEEQHLCEIGISDGFDRMTIERTALVTNPFQVAANRLKEMVRDKDRHGSCGMGIGETVADHTHLGTDETLYMGDLENTGRLRAKLAASQAFKREQLRPLIEGLDQNEYLDREWGILTDESVIDLCVTHFTAMISRVQLVDESHLTGILENDGKGSVLFEGAQGVLLDQDYGTFPYATRSKTTFENAVDLLGDFLGPVLKLGVTRSYMTRHGAGPFVTEDENLTHPERHNCNGPWQQSWRQGHLDLVALDYAVRVIGGVDEMVVTHMDYVEGPQRVCTAYTPDFNWRLPIEVENQPRLQELERASKRLSELKPSYNTLDTIGSLLGSIEDVVEAPVTLTSHGPTAGDKRARI